MTSEKAAPFSHHIAELVQHQRDKMRDTDTQDDSRIVETLRQNLQDKYHDEVFLPRQALWTAFDSTLKEKEPTWTNPAILHPEERNRRYSERLHVADWIFENTSLDSLTRTTTTIYGLHVLDREQYRGDLKQELPKRSLGALALGRGSDRRKAYLAERIQAINAYTTKTTIRDLQTEADQPDIHFYGQSMDTFVTLEQLQQAQQTYTLDALRLRGIPYYTRPNRFERTFSAPITLPVELSEANFKCRRLPGDSEIDLESTYGDYAYLFEQKPSMPFFGEIDLTKKELLKHAGDETFAYLKAQMLFDHIEQSVLVAPTPTTDYIENNPFYDAL